MVFKVKIEDADGALVSEVQGEERDLQNLLQRATAYATNRIAARNFAGAADNLKQPLRVSWEEEPDAQGS